MEKENNLSILNKKIYRSFLWIILLLFVFSFFFSLIKHDPKIIKPDFFLSYLFYQTVFHFADYFILAVYFFLFCAYSLFFRKESLRNEEGKRYLFHEITGAGINLIIFSVFFYFFSLEVLIPSSKQKLESIVKQCQLADKFISIADQYYEKGEKKEALSVYENYAKIVAPNKYINDRIRTLRVELFEDETEGGEGSSLSFPDNLFTYQDLAEYYYQEGDYFSAWFYYLYLEKGTPADQRYARDRIENIKKILQYRNSLMTDYEWQEFVDEKTKEMQKIYRFLTSAASKLENEEYLEAYHLYRELWSQYPHIRDAQVGKENACRYLRECAMTFSEAENAAYYTGKNNFLFFYSDSILMKIGTLRQVMNMDLMVNQYFFFDTQLCFLDENKNIVKTIFAKYGKVVDKKLLFLTYEEDEPENVFSPVIDTMREAEWNERVKGLSEEEKKSLFAFYSLEDGVYSLKSKEEAVIRSLSAMTREKRLLQQELPAQQLEFQYDMGIIYHLSYDYENASDFSILKLLHLYRFYASDDNNSLGFSKGFIGAAVAEKVSKLFIFLYTSFILLALFLKYRPKEYNLWYLLLAPFVLGVLYLLISLMTFFSTLFFHILGNVFSITAMFFLSLILNLVILVVVLFCVTGCRIEYE